MNEVKIHPHMSDLPLIFLWLCFLNLSCVCLVNYVCNRIDWLTFSLVMPLKSKLEKMIEHLVNRQRLWWFKEIWLKLSLLPPAFILFYYFFFGMVSWKKLVLRYTSKTITLRKANVICVTGTLGITWGKEQFFEQPDSWLLSVEVCAWLTRGLSSPPSSPCHWAKTPWDILMTGL